MKLKLEISKSLKDGQIQVASSSNLEGMPEVKSITFSTYKSSIQSPTNIAEQKTYLINTSKGVNRGLVIQRKYSLLKNACDNVSSEIRVIDYLP